MTKQTHMTQFSNRQASSKRKRRIEESMQDDREYIYVTFIVPNMVDAIYMREIFDEAILQGQAQGGEED